MEKKFQAGDKVILETRKFSSCHYSIEYVEKIHKTGRFVLKGSKQQYSESGRSTTTERFSMANYVYHYTDELWEEKFKPIRTKNKRNIALSLIEKIQDEKNTRPQPCRDAVKALDDIEQWSGSYGSIKDKFETIRAALTQLPKTIYHSDLETSKDIERFINKLPPELETPKADVDLMVQAAIEQNGLKEGNVLVIGSVNSGIEKGVRWMAAQGYIGGGWQPIETAPKDGTSILVYGTSPRTGDSWHEVACYNDLKQMYMSGSRLVGHDFLTHWMPLPAAPKKEVE